MTPIPVDPIDDAVPLSRALVVDHAALRPPEEPFAALAGDHAVVNPAGLVPADLARDDLNLG